MIITTIYKIKMKRFLFAMIKIIRAFNNEESYRVIYAKYNKL